MTDKEAPATGLVDRIMEKIEDVMIDADVDYPAGREVGPRVSYDDDAIRNYISAALQAPQEAGVEVADLLKSFAVYTVEEDEDAIRLSVLGQPIACWGDRSPQGKALLQLDALHRSALSQPVATPAPSQDAAVDGEPTAFLIERLAGDGYGSPRSIVDAAKYDPRRDDFWVGDAKTRHLVTPLYAATRPAEAQAVAEGAYQDRVHKWMMACFNDEIAFSKMERNHRFLEEALELVQSMGCTKSEALQLVDYVFDREIGEPFQEVGGVLVCLAALCTAASLKMDDAGEAELARIWTKVEKIRAKHAAKPQFSPLPGLLASPATGGA